MTLYKEIEKIENYCLKLEITDTYIKDLRDFIVSRANSPIPEFNKELIQAAWELCGSDDERNIKVEIMNYKGVYFTTRLFTLIHKCLEDDIEDRMDGLEPYNSYWDTLIEYVEE